jgi:hypothetical protein
MLKQIQSFYDTELIVSIESQGKLHEEILLMIQ